MYAVCKALNAFHSSQCVRLHDTMRPDTDGLDVGTLHSTASRALPFLNVSCIFPLNRWLAFLAPGIDD